MYICAGVAANNNNNNIMDMGTVLGVTFWEE
jgi:hypothetical protein